MIMVNHKFGKLDWRLNTTLVALALIAKENDASWIRDYRPISLVTSFYKIMSKALANRLKVCLEKIIDVKHGSFIKGRRFSDGILVANALVDNRIKSWK